MTDRLSVSVRSVATFFFAWVYPNTRGEFVAPGSRQSVLTSRIGRQWETSGKTDRGSGMERTWNCVWRLISDGREEEVKKENEGGFKGLIDGLSFLALVLSPHALLLHNPFIFFLSHTFFYLFHFSLHRHPSPSTSYHLCQATWPIGAYGNQLEADNNW